MAGLGEECVTVGNITQWQGATYAPAWPGRLTLCPQTRIILTTTCIVPYYLTGGAGIVAQRQKGGCRCGGLGSELLEGGQERGKGQHDGVGGAEGAEARRQGVYRLQPHKRFNLSDLGLGNGSNDSILQNC